MSIVTGDTRMQKHARYRNRMIEILLLGVLTIGCASREVSPTEPPEGIVEESRKGPIEETPEKSSTENNSGVLPNDPFSSASSPEKSESKEESKQKETPESNEPEFAFPSRNKEQEKEEKEESKSIPESKADRTSPASYAGTDSSVLFTKFQSQLRDLPGDTRARLARAFLHLLQDEPERAYQLMSNMDSEAIGMNGSSNGPGMENTLKQLLKGATFFRLGENKKGYLTLDSLLRDWKEYLPLEIVKSLFVRSVDGFENYKRRGNRVFSPGEYFLLYTVARNFGLNRSENTRYTVSLDLDFEIYRKEWDAQRSKYRRKKVRWPQGKNVNASLKREYEIRKGHQYVLIRLQMPKDIPSGENYELEVHVNDNVWNKSAEETVPFEIQ